MENNIFETVYVQPETTSVLPSAVLPLLVKKHQLRKTTANQNICRDKLLDLDYSIFKFLCQ